LLLQLEAQDFEVLQPPETAPGAGGILSVPVKGQSAGAAALLEQPPETAPGAASLHEEEQLPPVAPGDAVLQQLPSVPQQDPLVAPGAASVFLLAQPVRTTAAARAAAVKMVFMVTPEKT